MCVCLTVHISYHILDLDAMYLDLTRDTSLLYVSLLVIYYYLFFFIPNHNGILCNRHFPDLYLNSEYHFYYITAVVYVQIFLLSSV